MKKFFYMRNLIGFESIILTIIWFLIISGINVNIDHLNIKVTNNNILYTIRAYSQIFIFIFLIYKNLKIPNFYSNINIFFKLFLLYNFIQIFSLFLSDNNNLNLIYNISSLNVLLFLNLIFIDKKNEIEKIFFLVILLLSIVFFIYYLELYYYLIFENRIFYGHYESNSKFLPNFLPPRSSGIGRMALILFIFIIVFKNFKISKNLLIFIIMAIILTQSRANIGIFFFLLLIISFSKYFGLENLQFKNIFHNLIYFLLIPLAFSALVSQMKLGNVKFLKDAIVETKIYSEFKKFSEKEKTNKKEPIEDYKVLRDLSPISFSSYRVDDWKKLILLTKENIIIGNGTQADRFLINQTASNSLIYFFSSAGGIGVLIYIILYINIAMLFLKKINFLKINKLSNDNFIFACFIIFIFSLRGFVESSFAVFGVDYIFFIISLYVISYEKKTKN